MQFDLRRFIASGRAARRQSFVCDMTGRDFSGARIETENTHGTGCTLSSAIACGLAAGWELPKAVECARWYLRGALKADPKLGHGNGPVNHCFAIPECFGREQL